MWTGVWKCQLNHLNRCSRGRERATANVKHGCGTIRNKPDIDGHIAAVNQIWFQLTIWLPCAEMKVLAARVMSTDASERVTSTSSFSSVQSTLLHHFFLTVINPRSAHWPTPIRIHIFLQPLNEWSQMICICWSFVCWSNDEIYISRWESQSKYAEFRSRFTQVWSQI